MAGTKVKVTVETKGALLEAYNAVLEEARKEFEDQKAEDLAAWKKDLARVKEEDNYQFNKDKRDREDALKVELESRVAEVTAREAKAVEREQSIGNAEATIADLQKKVDGIPAVAATSEKLGYAKGSEDAYKESEANARIKNAETTAEKGILKNQVENLKANVVTLENTVAALRADLVAANLRVENIATNAVTAAGQSKVTVQAAPSGK